MTTAPIDGEPWRLLREWLPANDDPHRPLMTVSTVGGDGAPDARTLLLSEFDRDGFYFHTDSRSRKVDQLAANPAVALTLVWPETRRQLVVLGSVEVATAQELAAAYRARSAYLQELAWLNTAEFVVLPDQERVSRWAQFAADHAAGFDQPQTWTGYLARPRRLTFWQGDPDTASRRIEFTAREGGWDAGLLPG